MQAIICQTIDFVKESFVWDSLAMTSLCGVNAGHIWSNYFGRKQLSVILKGEGFQLINLLNSLLLRPVLLTLCCPVCVWGQLLQRRADDAAGCCAGAGPQGPCPLVCRGFQGFKALELEVPAVDDVAVSLLIETTCAHYCLRSGPQRW